MYATAGSYFNDGDARLLNHQHAPSHIEPYHLATLA